MQYVHGTLILNKNCITIMLSQNICLLLNSLNVNYVTINYQVIFGVKYNNY